MDTQAAKPVSKKRNWKLTFVLIAAEAALVVFAGKGLIDVITNPIPVSAITEIRVNVSKDGTSGFDIRNVKLGEIKTGDKGSLEIDISGDVVFPLAPTQANP